MNKMAIVIGAVVLLAGGYYLGKSGQKPATVIKVDSEPKAAFTSSGAEEVAAAASAGMVVRSLVTPTSGELIMVKDGESIQDAVAARQPRRGHQGHAGYLQGNRLYRQGQHPPGPG